MAKSEETLLGDALIDADWTHGEKTRVWEVALCWCTCAAIDPNKLTLGQVANVPPKEWDQLPNCGSATIADIEKLLKANGLKMASDEEVWLPHPGWVRKPGARATKTAAKGKK